RNMRTASPKLNANVVAAKVVVSMLLALAAIFCPRLEARTQPEWHTGIFQGREVTYQVVDGNAIYQGDIALGSADEIEAETARAAGAELGFPPGFHTLSAFNSSPTRFWPNAVVPYEVDSTVPN